MKFGHPVFLELMRNTSTFEDLFPPEKHEVLKLPSGRERPLDDNRHKKIIIIKKKRAMPHALKVLPGEKTSNKLCISLTR